ncbi:phosphorylated adapter RNA export protein-like [Styela clava]
MASSYRTVVASKIQISSDEGEVNSSDSNSDDDDISYMEKRAKTNANNYSETNKPAVQNNFTKPKRSKNANIWGSVLTEQSSQDISTNLGAVGMQHLISRGPESFDLPSHFGHKKRDVESDSNESSNDESEEQHNQCYDTEMQQHKTNEAEKNGSQGRRRKRKASKKKKNVPTFKPGQEVNLNRRCELADTDPVDKVAEEIAFRLWERKKDLIRSLTETLGVKKAIDFCNKTQDIEKSGGLLTMTGLRRRTPGGTFLYLIRNDPNLDQQQINNIFSVESERERMQWEQRKIAKRKKKPEPMEQIPNSWSMAAESKDGHEMDFNTNDISIQSSNMSKTFVADSNFNNVNSFFENSSKVMVSGFQKLPAELSDGEVVDTDEDIENSTSFG